MRAAPIVSAVDRKGTLLPLDPGKPVLDLPLLTVAEADTASAWRISVLAGEMARVAEMAPDVFAVISEARHERDFVMLRLGESGIRLRYRPPISERRLRDGVVAMNDAIARFEGQKLREVDLRYEDQVVVRVAGARS